jgi:uncharacterized RDD family membrane protein YckC
MADPEAASGVFFLERDYVGVSRRLLIDFVDTALVIALCAVFGYVVITVWPHEESLTLALFACLASIWFGYFVILKRSRFRTLGYILGGARIVNLQGQRPSVLSLLSRILFVAAGPANFLIDLFWIPTDPCRQAIRDKFAHTYVVRKDAVPAGTGPIVYRTYVMLGTTFLFQEVNVAAAANV